MSRNRRRKQRKQNRRKPELETAFDLNEKNLVPLDTPKPKRKRPRRVFVPGGVYHARCYGNNRIDLFPDQDHHDAFDHLLEEGVEAYGHKILSFKKLPDHVHLVVRVADVFLDRIMHNLCRRYADWYNKRHGRTGHLFGRRYSAVLVDKERYLAGLVAFVHSHGVRSGLLLNPEEDVLSSYPAYLDPARARELPWLDTGVVLAGLDPVLARQQLRASIRELDLEIPYSRGVPPDRRFLGDEDFIQQCLDQALPLPRWT